MTIKFKIIENKLILSYCPFSGFDEIVKKVNSEDGYWIKNTFHVFYKHLFKIEDEYESLIEFIIGTQEDNYIKIDKEIIESKNNFYFDIDFPFKQKYFIADLNISILGKIDQLIENDLFIGNSKQQNIISVDDYIELISHFPSRTELKKYTNQRISVLLKETFPNLEKHELLYNKYIRKYKCIGNMKVGFDKIDYISKIEIEKFSIFYDELQYMLNNEMGYDEYKWQEKIYEIIKLLYPKYILNVREVSINGIDGHDKRPDYVLIDANGYIDLLEIKKPSVKILSNLPSYRNNYVPVRELSGTIQQIEKYILCLNKLDSNSDTIKKLSKLLPQKIRLQVVNPQGILILGRSNNFNEQQTRDFELIKRQYKNIAEIITYDDLLFRMKNIITVLKSRLEEEKKNEIFNNC